jgi:hypothetical protein
MRGRRTVRHGAGDTVGQVGHQQWRGLWCPPIVPLVQRTGGQPPPPKSARPACPPLSPCPARRGGQPQRSSDAVSHLSHLGPLRCNERSGANSRYALSHLSHLSHRVPLPSGRARACAGRQARQAASGRSRAIRWRCRRETGRRSRSRLLGATGSRLVLARWRRTTLAAGLRRANRTPETRLQTKRFGAACEPAPWSSAHAASATSTGSYGACRVGQWPEHGLVLIR